MPSWWYFPRQKVASSVLRDADNCSSVYKVKILDICMHDMWFYKLENLEQSLAEL